MTKIKILKRKGLMNMNENMLKPGTYTVTLEIEVGEPIYETELDDTITDAVMGTGCVESVDVGEYQNS